MPYDPPAARRAKQKCSSEARRLMNFNCTWQKCQLMAAANFTSGDLFVTLTYGDGSLPVSRRAADSLLSKFLRQLRSSRRSSGSDLKYIRCTHELAGDGGRRLHHHIVINSVDAQSDWEQILSLWPHGMNVDIRRISGSGHYVHDDFMELAQYLTRERHPSAALTAVGARSWSCSRNLKKPVRSSVMVEDNVTVEAPPGSFVLDTDERRNEWGTYKYIKYLLPDRAAAPVKPPRRRRE